MKSVTGIFAKSDPFETCYQNGDESTYCWTKSYGVDAYFTGTNFHQCIPCGPAWHSIDAHYVNPATLPTRSCGPPCKKMAGVGYTHC